MSSPAEHLEHAEHAHHAAHDGFERKVAMTISIVAAVLACTTLLSHRGHTETLRLQGEANRLQTEADILHTRASDQWGFYQAKNIRAHEYQALGQMLGVLARQAGSDAAVDKLRADWTQQVQKYETELPQMQDDARKLEGDAEGKLKEAERRLEESHAVHRRVDRYDLGELCVEFALVLCSVAVLTRQKPFWLSGIFFGVAGAAVVLGGWFGWGLAHP
jgi:hypothetical protein